MLDLPPSATQQKIGEVPSSSVCVGGGGAGLNGDDGQ